MNVRDPGGYAVGRQRWQRKVILGALWEKEMSVRATNIREAARELVESLSPNATWEDLMHEIYVREAIDAGLDDSAAGRTADVGDVREQYGLPR